MQLIRIFNCDINIGLLVLSLFKQILMNKLLSFQEIITNLQSYWQKYGCAILQPYDLEVGAGTFHPATVLRCLGTDPWRVIYVQPSRRPTDSRYGTHPNRVQHYYQMQVIIKPSIDEIQEIYLDSLNAIGIDPKKYDIRFVEDDWESPTIGAAGLGWEVWCNGMEISQFTYMQQIGGIECSPVSVEITYGLERIALYTQNIDSIGDIYWNPPDTKDNSIRYRDVDFVAEKQFSKFNLELADTEMINRHFHDYEKQCKFLVENELPIVAYDYCIKASHLFNLLDSRGKISATERAKYIERVRHLAKLCCSTWLNLIRKNNE